MKRFAAFLAGLFVSLVLVIVIGAAILGYGIGDIKGLVCSFMNWRLEGRTIEERLDEIASKRPDLVAAAESMKGDLSVLVFKQERIVELRSPGWTNPRVYQMTGFSGALGPKLEKDDGQIPEGVYGIESLNPGGMFHLERPAEVRVEDNHYADPFWTDHAVTNIYSRKVVLRTIGHYETEKMFRPEADLRHGTIELPRYRLT